jgi:ABC-2 type transport system ATP-binding protein
MPLAGSVAADLAAARPPAAAVLSTAGDTINWPSGSTWLVLAPIAVLVLGVVGWALVDLIRAPAVKYLPKAVWALIIVVASMPLGAIVYLVVGRDRGAPAAVPPAAAGTPHAANTSMEARTVGTTRPAVADDDAVAPAERTVVHTRGLTKDYGGTGLFDVDLSVPCGCVYGLVGPNGAGKTTLLSLLTGTRRPDRGEIGVQVPRSRIAVCPDVPEFDQWLTAWEVVDLARALTGAGHDPATVDRALTETGLASAADTRVGGFSRGMTQRLGLACALVTDPDLLILDEPTSALDPAGRADVLALVAGMRGRRTVIFSSHILADVQRVADRVGILRNGRLLYQGRTQHLIDDHLRPRWLVRLAGGTAALRAELESRSWATGVQDAGPSALQVDAVSIEAGERGIPEAVAARHERLVSCEPVAADLESAFLALTRETAGQRRAATGAPMTPPVQAVQEVRS